MEGLRTEQAGSAENTLLRCGFIAIIILHLAWLSRSYALNDALIYDRYIRNALNGYGLVYNPGQHVNGLTSPLYCYLLLGTAKLLYGRVLLASKVLFILTLFGACVLAEQLVRFSGILTASLAYFYTTQGMETDLFLMLLSCALIFYRDARWDWLPTAYVLLALTRFEGGLLAVILLFFQIRRRERPCALALLPPTALLTSFLLLNLHWYGQGLPTSAGAKFGQAVSGYWGRWPMAFLHVGILFKTHGIFRPILFCLPPGAILAFTGFLHLRKRGESWCVPLIIFLAGLLAFYIGFNIPGYHWYYAPFFYFASVLIAANVGNGRLWCVTAIGTAAALCTIQARYLSSLQPAYPYLRASSWLRTHAPAHTRIATVETGTIGWSLPNDEIIDILGLTTPKNAGYIAHREPGRWLAEDKPDYIVVHDAPVVWETVVRDSPAEYRALPMDFGGVHLYVKNR